MANRISFDNIASFSKKNIIVKRTIQEVFKTVRDNFQKYNKVTDQDLISLNAIFGETFEKALEILEGNKITYFHLKQKNIGIYQVEGSLCKSYMIYSSVNFCSCSFYKHQVAEGTQIICKHVLASVLADITGKKLSIETTDEHLRDLIIESGTILKGWNAKDTCMEQYMYSSPTAPFMFPDSNNWAHVPPQTMPWGTPAELQPSVVRFTAGNFNGSLLSCKRKSEPSIDMPPAKMLVTDEKMAAHMQSLHISDIENEKVLSNMSCKDESMETDTLPKLVLSDEIKNLKTEMIFPESVFKRLEKPEMALVLWQPPLLNVESKLNEMNKSCKTKNEQSEEKSTENNNRINEKSEVEKTDDKSMDITMEANIMNNIDNTFRPIDPVPKPSTPTQYYQPVPHFQGYTSFF